MQFIHPDFAAGFNPASADCGWTRNLVQQQQQENTAASIAIPSDVIETWGAAAQRWEQYRAVLEEKRAAQEQQRQQQQVVSRAQQQKERRKPHSQQERRLSFNDSSGDDDEDNDNEALKVGASIKAALAMLQRNQHSVQTTSTAAIDGDKQKGSNKNSSNSLPIIREMKSIKSALDMELATDVEAWSDSVERAEISSSSASSSSSSTTAIRRPAAPEALRWMSAAEKNVESRDWVTAVKNYSNALEAQARYCSRATSTTTTSNNSSAAPATEDSSSSFNFSWGTDALAALFQTMRAWTNAEKTVMAVIYSNRAGCRLGLFDFDGCLEDANEALSYSSRHPPALARCAQCLIVQPWVGSGNNSNSKPNNSKNYTAASTASPDGKSIKTGAQKTLDRCDAANEAADQQLQQQREQSAASGKLVSLFFVTNFVSKFDTTSLREAANHMAEFELNRRSGSIVGALQCVTSAAAACNDPRFDLLRMEILAATGAYEEAAAEAASVTSMAPGLAEAWSLRGACTFRATADGSGAASAVQMYWRAADIYRKLNLEIGRCCFASSSFSTGGDENGSACSSSSSEIPRGSAVRAARRNSASSSSTANSTTSTTTTMTSTLAVGVAKNTSIADTLQKLDRLHKSRFAQLFEANNFSGASQVCTEILSLDLIGNRQLRAFVLLRRAMCLVELGNAPRGIDDATTALDMLSMDATSSSSTTANSAAAHSRPPASSFLPFSIALLAVRAQCHHKAHSLPRALEDIGFAIVLQGELDAILSSSTSRGDNDDDQDEESKHQNQQSQQQHTDSSSSSLSSLYRAVLSRHSELTKLCKRSFLVERQDMYKSLQATSERAQGGDYYAQAQQKQQNQREYAKQFASHGEDSGGAETKAKQQQQQQQRQNSYGSNSGSTNASAAATNTTTHYDILGISRDADRGAVIKAFRAAALRWHPDKWVGQDGALQKEAEERFKAVNAAHSVLGDEMQRLKYDATIDVAAGKAKRW